MTLMPFKIKVNCHFKQSTPKPASPQHRENPMPPRLTFDEVTPQPSYMLSTHDVITTLMYSQHDDVEYLPNQVNTTK
ncbi:hypothetical protein PR048_018736 [Dryococelus australis]|uniref:Uncharacterized protein n=1 Tax=Dryococelus australis TaxID=614101 RepID=A0ABQ9HDW0_9NEOP|nr:hypothetical protein PR048_018736 [Dryococelus australis]